MSKQQDAAAWRRTDDDDSPGWQITGPDGAYRLVTDTSVTLFGRAHVEAMIAAYDLPFLP